MPKIAIVDSMHQDGINLLKNNPKFECEIIEDLSKKNLIFKLPTFDGITLRRGKIDSESAGGIIAAGNKCLHNEGVDIIGN